MTGQIIALQNAEAVRRPRPVHRLSPQSLCGTVETAVAATFAVPPAHLRAKTRGVFLVAFARQSAMYLAHVVFGLSFTQVGRYFGRDRTTAAHAARLIEERRDDPAIDALLGALETACRALSDRAPGGGEVRS
ncbi:MAG: helix-turn-helix domain-containing protein [Xanthobacteraceae bacterium]